MLSLGAMCQRRENDMKPITGGCTVNIAVKWGIIGGPYGHDCCIVPQSVSVQTDGTVTVSKFGITARRKPNEPYQ